MGHEIAGGIAAKSTVNIEVGRRSQGRIVEERDEQDILFRGCVAQAVGAFAQKIQRAGTNPADTVELGQVVEQIVVGGVGDAVCAVTVSKNGAGGVAPQLAIHIEELRGRS